MKLIIGVGSVGFEALLYFESNFSDLPDCVLLLSDKKFEERAKKLKSSSKKINDANLFQIQRINPILTHQAKDEIQELSMDSEVYILAGLGGIISGKLSAKVAELAVKSATKVVCFAALPFNFEGIKKRKIADDNLALLKEIGVETIEMDNQELFKHINNKTTFDEAFKIYFEKMAELIGLKGL